MNVSVTKSQIIRKFVLIFFCIYISPIALSQSFDAGYTKYQRGDFKGAERSFLQAIYKDMPDEIKAKTHKFLGICLYQLGNKSGANKSFKEALALNPNINIDASEVIDTSVIDFFSKTKQEFIASPPPPSIEANLTPTPTPIPVPVADVGKKRDLNADPGNDVALKSQKPKRAPQKKNRSKNRTQANDAIATESKSIDYNPAAEFESDTGISPYAPAPVTSSYLTPQYRSTEVANTATSTNGNYFVALLPFGAGQFQNRSIFNGIVFFAGEAGSLFYYYSKSKSAKSAMDAIKLLEDEKEANGEELTEDDKVFFEESQSYIARTKKQASYGLYAFGALWIVGVIEAIVNDPIANAAQKGPNRGQRPGRYGEVREQSNNRLLTKEERYYRKDWTVRLLPEHDLQPSGAFDSGTLKLLWELNF